MEVQRGKKFAGLDGTGVGPTKKKRHPPPMGNCMCASYAYSSLIPFAENAQLPCESPRNCCLLHLPRGLHVAILDLHLVVHPELPHLGASPGGVVSYDCCGLGVLEIKCPFSCKNKSFTEASRNNLQFCLTKCEDSSFN